MPKGLLPPREDAFFMICKEGALEAISDLVIPLTSRGSIELKYDT